MGEEVEIKLEKIWYVAERDVNGMGPKPGTSEVVVITNQETRVCADKLIKLGLPRPGVNILCGHQHTMASLTDVGSAAGATQSATDSTAGLRASNTRLQAILSAAHPSV